MDKPALELSPTLETGIAGRRSVLGAVSAAGMALLASLGLAEIGDTKKKNHSRGKNHKHQTQAEK